MKRAGVKNPKNIRKMLAVVGAIVKGKAVKYAPRSMTKGEYTSTLVGGVTERATSSFTTGSLKRSITLEKKEASVEIGVPSNSKAGKYAEKMHDEHGKSWNNLGWQNDASATHKYIYKAYEDSEKEIDRALDNLLDNLIRRL
jgi:hypothetical protein